MRRNVFSSSLICVLRGIVPVIVSTFLGGIVVGSAPQFFLGALRICSKTSVVCGGQFCVFCLFSFWGEKLSMKKISRELVWNLVWGTLLGVMQSANSWKKGVCDKGARFTDGVKWGSKKK